MTYLFKSETVDYDYICNEKETTILFLHGWGGDKNSFAFTYHFLQSKYNILAITLPTINPTILSFDLNDYKNLVIGILNLHGIKNLIIVCHSFGFRVATVLSKKIKIKKMIITGGAGIKNASLFRKIYINNLKILSKQNKNQVFLKNFKNLDYTCLTSTNKKTFQNIINFDLKYLMKFYCPMLLFWGTRDKETPLKSAKIIKKFNKSKLIVSTGSHFAYLENPDQFKHAIGEFLNDHS